MPPSGFDNRVIAEGFRAAVQVTPRAKPGRIRIIYRDGSEARSFPLRCITFAERLPSNGITLRLALASFRHPEMDPIVDGCLLRNREISGARKAADSDEAAYLASRRHLRTLADLGVSRIHLYQVGLEAAVVGFYRAVVEAFVEDLSIPAVIPMFYQESGSKYEEGSPWVRGP